MESNQEIKYQISFRLLNIKVKDRLEITKNVKIFEENFNPQISTAYELSKASKLRSEGKKELARSLSKACPFCRS